MGRVTIVRGDITFIWLAFRLSSMFLHSPLRGCEIGAPPRTPMTPATLNK